MEVDFWYRKKIEKSIVIEPTLDRFLSNMDRNLSITVRNTGIWSAFEIALTGNGFHYYNPSFTHLLTTNLNTVLHFSQIGDFLA